MQFGGGDDMIMVKNLCAYNIQSYNLKVNKIYH